jgi:hypothetical protein
MGELGKDWLMGVGVHFSCSFAVHLPHPLCRLVAVVSPTINTPPPMH